MGVRSQVEPKMCLLVVRLGMEGTKGGGVGVGWAVSQRTDLSSDVLKGGRTDQGEAYQEHILGENQRDGELRTRSAGVCLSACVSMFTEPLHHWTVVLKELFSQ